MLHHICPVRSHKVFQVCIQPLRELLNGWGHCTTQLREEKIKHQKLVLFCTVYIKLQKLEKGMYNSYPATCVPVHYWNSFLTSQGIHIQLGRVFTSMPPLLRPFSKIVQHASSLRLTDDQDIKTENRLCLLQAQFIFRKLLKLCVNVHYRILKLYLI